MSLPVAQSRQTLNALQFLRRQTKAFLLALDDGVPLEGQRRLLEAALAAATYQAREAERSLCVTAEAIDREMARAREPLSVAAENPLSHAANLNGAGEVVTLQPGADPQ